VDDVDDVDRSRERDPAVERLLRQSRPLNGGVTDACLDAETLAAWVDGGLSGAALEDAQSHVADCARCQTLVGTLARISSTVPQNEPARASRRWLAWLVPLTAAAAAVALWVALPGNNFRNALVTQAPQVQDKVAELKAPEPAPPENRPQASQATRAPLAPVRKDAFQQPTVIAGAAKKEVASNDAARDQSVNNGVVGRLEAENQKSAAAPLAAPAADAAPSALAETVVVARSAAGVAGGVGVVTTEIVSPDPSVRWRIARSLVQRSTNGGSTWDGASLPITAELTAGAAPSPSVCWLVGRGGVVLLTVDGRTWRRVAFPEMTDLSAVRATDARSASVSTLDGRTFSTTDGGTTWVP
jgi:hypothetical protein